MSIKSDHRLFPEEGLVYRKGRTRLSIALVFPNTYEVGMANLGFQTVYRLFNEMDDVRCERVFFEQDGAEARSFEGGRRLSDFDVVAFSLSFELDYPNVPAILQSSGIPLRTADRTRTDPIVMAGGVSVTLNPEPLALLIDAFVIGESEEVLESLASQLLSHISGSSSREELLKSLARMPGLYVPGFYKVIYGADGCISGIETVENVPVRVQRQFLKEIDQESTYSPIMSRRSHFREMFLLEVGRGCGRGCRFCAAGFIYRPVRFRSGDKILSDLERHGGGWKKVGLIGSAVSDHPRFEPLCSEMADRGYELGISSVRADALTPGMIGALVRSGVRTMTIAPEAGSERLRERIGKRLSDEEILAAVEMAAIHGMAGLKLYFIIGFPFEQEEDISAIAVLVERIRDAFCRQDNNKKKITITVQSFIPKANTPLQWSRMEEEKALERKLACLLKELKGLPGVHVTVSSARMAMLQGMFSLGDRRLGEALCLKAERALPWKKAWHEAQIDPDFCIRGDKMFAEVLPWEIIDAGLSKRMLWDEYQRALTGSP